MRNDHPSWVFALCAGLLCLGCDGDDGDNDAGDDGIEAPSGCDILRDLAGDYTVTGSPTGNEHRGANSREHQRQSIQVTPSLDVDFDTDLAFGADEIMACYDRRSQDFDRRIQVSYGADDDGPVLNFYMESGDVVDEIQYRHNSDGVNVRVAVSRD